MKHCKRLARVLPEMLCALCLASVILSLPATCPSAVAQETRTQVLVRIPQVTSKHEFDRAEVSVNGQLQMTAPGSVARFNVPAKTGDNVRVQVRMIHTGFDVKEWDQAIRLNGSGHVDYVAKLTGSGIFGQWPLVIFRGTKPLDVFIDSNISGTTEISKGVSPNDEHVFEWKSSDSVVCKLKVALPVNVTRTYRCNAVRKKVE